MSKGPGGFTAHIDCMIIAGFPGIGKTSCFNAYKKRDILAKTLDFDVKDWGTTNGMDVADPAAYVQAVDNMSKTTQLIFVTVDPAVRQKLRQANLFYIVLAPEFPPAIASQMPGFRPDPMTRALYMRRFHDNLGYNSKAAALLDGSGYEHVLTDLFMDPMPHLITPLLTPEIVDVAWQQVEQLTRQTLSQPQMVEIAKKSGFQPPPDMFPSNTTQLPKP